jgi:porin
MLGVAVLGASAPAVHAQSSNPAISIGPSEALSPPGAPSAPPVEHLLPDYGGYRAALSRVGIELQLNWIAEVAGNVSGGTRRSASYAGQVGFQADIDWEKLANVRGLSTHVVIVNRQGSNVGSNFGDTLNQVQEIYGAGGNTVVHLVYAYAEESLLNGRVNLAVGRAPELNDFSASPLYCNFINNSLCGNPKALPESGVGFSSYPDAVFFGRIRVRPTANTYIQTGIYEVNQNLYTYPQFRTGFKFNGSRDTGVMIPVEAAYEPSIGPQALPGHYKVGFGYDTSTYPKYLTTAASVLAGRGNGNDNKYGIWVLADQMVYRTGPGPTDGLTLLAGYVHTNPSVSNYANQVFAGAVYKNFWHERPQDTISFLFNYANISGALGNQQSLDLAFGLPTVGSSTNAVQKHQEIIELNYNIHVTQGVSFQPLFQYYFRPNGVNNIKDAAILGFKSNINF